MSAEGTPHLVNFHIKMDVLHKIKKREHRRSKYIQYGAHPSPNLSILEISVKFGNPSWKLKEKLPQVPVSICKYSLSRICQTVYWLKAAALELKASKMTSRILSPFTVVCQAVITCKASKSRWTCKQDWFWVKVSQKRSTAQQTFRKVLKSEDSTSK